MSDAGSLALVMGAGRGEANSDARLSALRTSLSVVVLVAVAALFLTGLIPTKPVGQAKRERATPKAAEASAG
jgi:hypothetical protein